MMKTASLSRILAQSTFNYNYKPSSDIEFVVITEAIIKQLTKGRAYLIDQLQRAGSSVPLNIAEGAGEFSTNEKIRFYRMTKRSATEYAGILDICARLNLIDEKMSLKSRDLLIRIVSMWSLGCCQHPCRCS